MTTNVRLIKRVELAPDKIKVELDPERLTSLSGDEFAPDEAAVIEATLSLRKRGVEQKLILGGQTRAADVVLVNTLAKAHAWLGALKGGQSIKGIASEAGKSTSFIRTRIPLALLSPSIQKALTEGSQPVELTADRIIKSQVPHDWRDQERLYGFTGLNPP